MFRNITASIYRIKGVEKAVAKSNFMSNFPSIQKDQHEPSLKTFICLLTTKHGLSSRCQDLRINSYKVSVNYKRTTAVPDYPKGRVFAVDTQEQFFIAPTQAFQCS